MKAHVQVDQLADVLGRGLGELQLAQALAGELGAHHLVVVEAHLAVGGVAGIRLAYVMEQGGPPKNEIGTVFLLLHGLAQYGQRVRVHVLVLRVLVGSHAQRRDLRKNIISNPGVNEQVNTLPRRDTADELVELHLHALHGDALDFARHVGHGIAHALGDVKLQLRRKTRSTEHAERIIVEGNLRRIWGIEDAIRQVLETAHRIVEFAGAVGPQLDGHGVDLEIAAHEIALEGIAVHDLGVA